MLGANKSKLLCFPCDIWPITSGSQNIGVDRTVESVHCLQLHPKLLPTPQPCSKLWSCVHGHNSTVLGGAESEVLGIDSIVLRSR